MPTADPPRKHRDYSHGEMIADAAVHAAALVAGVIGFSVLFQKVTLLGATSDGVAMTVYAAGFFLLFGFSCAYNMTPPSPAKWLLRRFDHASIYLMIGGTYTALLSQALSRILDDRAFRDWCGQARSAARRSSCSCPVGSTGSRSPSILVLGWSALIAVKPLVAALPAQTLAFVAMGGALYSIGVAFHRWQSLKFQNAIWHSCVTAAAACHFAGVFQAVGR